MNVFLDSSALAKRYVNEPGSARVEAIIAGATSLAICVICVPEVISGLCRLQRERKVSAQQYAHSKRALLQDVDDSVVIQITAQVVGRAVELMERWPLRSSDALHVAAAAE